MNYCLEPAPNIYFSSKIPHTVHFPKECPSILSIKLINCTDVEIHPTIQKTGHIFYYTFSKEESVFKYLGHSKERNLKKLLFLATFLEADAGNQDAQIRLADMYFYGYGTKPHIGHAIRYCTLAT